MRGTSNHEGGPDGFRLSPAPRGRTQTATTELRHSDWTDYRGLVRSLSVSGQTPQVRVG